MTGDVTEVASEVTCSNGNQVLVVGVEVVGTGSDDTYDYNQSTIKICINQTCVCCFKELYMWMWGGGGGGCRSMTRHGPIVMYFSGLNTQMHHSWEHLGILSPWDIVRLDIVLHGFLSLWVFVPLGFCPPGLLSSWVFVFLGFCHSSQIYRPTSFYSEGEDDFLKSSLIS